MTKTEFNEILKAHKKWLNGDEDGKRADLRGADLTGADLRWADLRGADLTGADLRWADLRGADLSEADLSEADLRGANLSRADLSEADLSEADLSGADLREADLRGADLTGADLRESDLSRADLTGADLREADLSRADLREADLSEADLSRAKNVFFPLACPEEGEFIAFKKAANGLIVKLQIPANAKRSSSTTRKCRSDKAIVLSIEYADGTKYKDESVCSVYDKNFVYTVGQEVSVPDYDDNRWNECSKGIHFFITREEAVRYDL